MRALAAAALGVLFGVGLLISGMTDPVNVIGFLDVAGAWNPALAFVMGGAVLVAAPFFAVARRRGQPVLGGVLDTPNSTAIDSKLLIGAAIFGIGWGLAGICPGPSLVLLGQAPGAVWLFVLAVAVGALAATGVGRLLTNKSESAHAHDAGAHAPVGAAES